MNVIIGAFTQIMGWLLDLFFQALTLIQYPRLWACIVLYAIATRFLFLPQKINQCKKRILSPVISRDLYDISPDFFDQSMAFNLRKQKKAELKKIYKKYKISNHSGLLLTLIQYPFLVALFYVVKNPQEFIPSLSTISAADVNTNLLFGISLDMVPQASLENGNYFVLIIPLFLMALTFLKMFASVKSAKTTAQKVKVYSLCALLVGLLGWFSYTLPLVISLYWAASDVTFYLFDLIIPKLVQKNKRIVKILEDFEIRKQALAAEEEAKKLAVDIGDTETVDAAGPAENHDGSTTDGDTQDDEKSSVTTVACAPASSVE